MLPAPSLRRIVALAGLGMGVLPSTSRGQSDLRFPPPILEITTAARVVNVYATVRDGKGRLVTDLGQERFRLRDNGAEQAIEYFARETDAPLSLALVVDTSASQTGLLPTEREKARAFVRTVLGPADRALVLRFDREVVLVQGLTNDAASLDQALDAVGTDPGPPPGAAEAQGGRPPRGTRLYDAIVRASELVSGHEGRKVLVLLTDGEDQGSRASLKAALDAAERAEVIVYSVLVADPLFYWARGRDFGGRAALEALQRKTGGWMVGEEAAGGLDEIAAELRAQYRLGFTPRPGRYDGSFHQVEVRVAGSHHTVRARRGYFATAE